MLKNWQNWCRLCAKIDSPNEDATYKGKSTADQLEIVKNFFGITLLPLERIESTTCDECGNFLAKLEHFGERCLKTDQMFRELMQKRSVSSTDLESIRCKYGINEEDTKNGSEDEEKYWDTFEMEIESSVVVKQEMSDEYVPLAKIQATENNNLTLPRPAPNQKMYVVSYKQQKVYTVVDHCGEEPDYDDFVKAVCDIFKIQGVTLYDHNEIQISRDAFKLVFDEIPPEYVIIKTNVNNDNIQASVTSTSSACNTNSSNSVKIKRQSQNPQQIGKKGGRTVHKPGSMTLEEMRKLKKKSIINPKGPGNCLLVSIAFGIVLLEENVKKRLSEVKSLKRNPKKLERQVEKLIVECNINRSGEHGLDEIRKIQEKHREFRFVVYNDVNNFKNVLFRGDKTPLNFNKVINLLFSENHFMCIRSPKAFFAYNYQCIHCDELYNNKYHRCYRRCLKEL